MKALRLLPQIKKAIPLLSRQSFAPFCFSSAAANPNSTNSSSDQDEGGSAVYRHSLKFQRPKSVHWRLDLWNSVCFIGTVMNPLKVLNDDDNRRFGVWTLLNVRGSPRSNGSFRILLQMWDEMAEMCSKHLKPDDFIYVKGRLGSYTKPDRNVNLVLRYKVIVKELNYVRHGQHTTSQKYEGSRFDEDVGGTALERYKNRLHLWQVYFASPHEWWDNRKCKVNPKQPDFKHKDTGEALWLSPKDPPWVKKQLRLLDTKMAEEGICEKIGAQSRVSKWEYDA
ncbi:hypothetical protein UlMin_034396 [Ulmus minor]